MNAEFIKMQGLGNTFILYKGPRYLSPTQVLVLCKKHGVDGLLVVSPTNEHKVNMKYWNADGSIAEMCGNGLRCVTKYAIDYEMVRPGEFTVQTDAGDLKVVWDGKDSDNIEVQVGKVTVGTSPVSLYGHQFYQVNVGNPHAITIVDDIKISAVKKVGSKVEVDPYFPHKTNVEFVEIQSDHKIYVRTWERGVGETLACGTGMVAAANMAVKIMGLRFPLDVEVLGGKARVWLDGEGYTRMIGPANRIHDT